MCVIHPNGICLGLGRISSWVSDERPMSQPRFKGEAHRENIDPRLTRESRDPQAAKPHASHPNSSTLQLNIYYKNVFGTREY